MAEQSSVYPFLNWAKERIDEMDAALASFETKASQMTSEAKVKADQLIEDLKNRRCEFAASIKKETESGEAAWARTKADLETQWNQFETRIQAYLETVGKQVEQQQVTFKDLAAVQVKAWREAAAKFTEAAYQLATERRADFDAALKQMKLHGSEAEARLQKLRQAGTETWSALNAALDESRKAFDRANQAAWDAFKRAAPPHR